MTGQHPRSGREPEIVRRLTAKLRSASPNDWNQIRDATSAIRGDEIDALWRRARHRSLWIPYWQRHPTLATGVFALGELAGELVGTSDRRTQRQVIAQARARGPSSLEPALMAAFLDLWELAADNLGEDRVTIEAILIAGSLAANLASDEAMLAEAWTPLASVVQLREIRAPT